MNICRVLELTTSSSSQERQNAIKILEDAASTDFKLLVEGLVSALSDCSQSQYIRSTAGIYLKNLITSNSPATKAAILSRWTSLPIEFRVNLRLKVLTTLGTESWRPSVVSQVVSSLASVEFPNKGWPDLIPTLASNIVQQGGNLDLRESSIEALGYMCQDLPSSVLSPHSNELLNFVIHSMQKSESPRIRLVATKALYNSLDIAELNFEIESQRNAIMQAVCECSVDTDVKIKVVGLQCLCRIVALYYVHMELYMNQALFAITLEAIKSPEEEVVLQGIEFWSALSEEERGINTCAEEDKEVTSSKYYSKRALPFVVPVLLQRLICNEEEESDDCSWTPHKAAGVCLMLLASECRNEIVGHVLPFVQENCVSHKRTVRDAALLALGSILEGPDDNILVPIINNAHGLLLKLCKDDSPQVRDTAMWVLGRIVEEIPVVLSDTALTVAFLSATFESLKDCPRVAANACWTFSNLIKELYIRSCNGRESRPKTMILSGQYECLISVSQFVFKRQDAEQNGLRTAAFELLMNLVEYHPEDCHVLILASLSTFLQEFVSLSTSAGQSAQEHVKMKISELYSLYCASLQSYFKVLSSSEMSQICVPTISVLMSTLKSMSLPAAHEDTLLTLGAVVLRSPLGSVTQYMNEVIGFALNGICNIVEPAVCASGASLLSDVCTTFGSRIDDSLSEIMSVLVRSIQTTSDDQVKQSLVGLMGDICIAVGASFRQYLPQALDVVRCVSSVKTAGLDDMDRIELVDEILSSCLEAYTGIIQGLYPNCVIPPDDLPIWTRHLPSIINFITNISKDPFHSDSTTRSCCGLIGDMLKTFKQQVKPSLQSPGIQVLIKEASNSNVSKTKTVGSWVMNLFMKI